MDTTTLHRAILVITALKAQYKDDFTFDMAVSQYLQGKANEGLRKAVMLKITLQDVPATKATLQIVTQQLRAHCQQSSLFQLELA